VRRMMKAFVMFLMVVCVAFSAEAGSKKKAKRFYNAGLKMAKAGKLDDAATKYRAALTENPKMYLAALDLGMIFVMQDRLPEAVAAYELAAQINPERVKAIQGYAGALDQVGAKKAASQQYRTLTKLEPDKIDVFKKMGDSALVAGSFHSASYDDAINAYLVLLNKNSGNYDATLGLGQAYYGKKNFGKSLEYFEKAVHLKPKSVKGWKGIGDVHQDNGKVEEAKKAYDKACDLSGGKLKAVCKAARLL
jgi:tetratricopeptide (TPR) repeat protein